jgi:hypothetical protein
MTAAQDPGPILEPIQRPPPRLSTVGGVSFLPFRTACVRVPLQAPHTVVSSRPWSASTSSALHRRRYGGTARSPSRRDDPRQESTFRTRPRRPQWRAESRAALTNNQILNGRVVGGKQRVRKALSTIDDALSLRVRNAAHRIELGREANELLGWYGPCAGACVAVCHGGEHTSECLGLRSGDRSGARLHAHV